jgi:hypothetical protein
MAERAHEERPIAHSRTTDTYKVDSHVQKRSFALTNKRAMRQTGGLVSALRNIREE